MNPPKILAPLFLAGVLALAACGSEEPTLVDAEESVAGDTAEVGSDAADTDTETTADASTDDASTDGASDEEPVEAEPVENDESEAESDSESEPESNEAAEEETMEEGGDTEDEGSNGDVETESEAAETAIAVDFGEWYLDMATTVPAGPVTYNITNSGGFDHRLAVVRGKAYEDLPQLANGAVDIEAMGEDFLGDQVDNIAAGGTGSVTWDLPAGDYVFFCPIAFGPNSHAKAGQVLSVTIS